MTIIRLPRGEWIINLQEQIGPKGGFGSVYAGSRKDFPSLAIKRLDITAEESANRELRIAEKLMDKEYSHIIPIYDAGQDAESDFYYVVMGRAERSLKDAVDDLKKMEEREAAQILYQIVLGLEEADGIVHRDLKPGNILFQDGKWKIGDFGIAKFVEESTSLQTLKDCLSPQYAAPEQWRFETVTVSTDLYALGCIGYQLITGHLPFSGKDIAEYQNQHLVSLAPTFETKIPLMRTLISMLLRKSPEARPTLERVRIMLLSIINTSIEVSQSSGVNALASAGAKEAERQSKEEAKRIADITALQKREQLGFGAFEILKNVRDEMFLKILKAAPVAKRDRDSGKLSLGKAYLGLRQLNGGVIFPVNPFVQSQWDVVCGAVIEVIQDEPKYIWSASLWYTNLGKDSIFRWYETSYWMITASRMAPFAIEDPDDADIAHAPISSQFGIASHPKPIDDEAIDDFIDQWSIILAKAHEGALRYPSRLPFN